MSSINSINGPKGIPERPPQKSNWVQNQDRPGNQPPPPPINVKFTQMGKLISAAGEADGSIKNELKQTIDRLIENLQNSNFNVDTFLETVSDNLKSFAEKSGVDLKSAILQIYENSDKMNIPSLQRPPGEERRPQGPPPPPHGSPEKENTESE